MKIKLYWKLREIFRRKPETKSSIKGIPYEVISKCMGEGFASEFDAYRKIYKDFSN